MKALIGGLVNTDCETDEVTATSTSGPGLVVTSDSLFADAETDPKGTQAEGQLSEENPHVQFIENEKQALLAVFNDIRAQSKQSKLVVPERWKNAEFIPQHLGQEDFLRLVFNWLDWDLMQNSRDSEKAEESPEENSLNSEHALNTERTPYYLSLSESYGEIPCSDIFPIEGKSHVYFYSDSYMTSNYANWSFLAEEGDSMVTMVSCIREESKLYPRPLLAKSLTNPPFCMAEEQVEIVYQMISESEDYLDIETTSASNGDVYYYSTKYLNPVYARSLAETFSVRRPLSL